MPRPLAIAMLLRRPTVVRTSSRLTFATPSAARVWLIIAVSDVSSAGDSDAGQSEAAAAAPGSATAASATAATTTARGATKRMRVSSAGVEGHRAVLAGCRGP